ncbi:hypothetical protein [Ferrovum sp.]|uniref:hypothetical protein n=2 Tax=Ferrovum sp. TaxID=2609467 RepID=UPI00260CC009|nr:hypothetical protein [Ferrovum sp.]
MAIEEWRKKKRNTDQTSVNLRMEIQMKKDEIRALLLEDINNFRLKAKFYESIRLSEAADYAKDLASNIELALTTMPSDSDSEIY